MNKHSGSYISPEGLITLQICGQRTHAHFLNTTCALPIWADIWKLQCYCGPSCEFPCVYIYICNVLTHLHYKMIWKKSHQIKILYKNDFLRGPVNHQIHNSCQMSWRAQKGRRVTIMAPGYLGSCGQLKNYWMAGRGRKPFVGHTVASDWGN